MMRRRIVLGVSGHQTAHLLNWTASIAEAGDQVRIVHAYRPIPYAAMDWQLPVDTDTVVQDVAVRHVHEAADRLRRLRPDVVVHDELAGDRAATVLLEAAAQADLVLVGIPHCDRSRAVLDQLLRFSPCPVLVLGDAAPQQRGPVTAVLRGDPADETVLEVAFAAARRRNGPLTAVKPWHPPLDGQRLYAEIAEQKALDTELEQWQLSYPEVPTLAVLLLGSSAAQLREHAGDAELLVLSRPSRASVTDALLEELVLSRSFPTLVVAPEPFGSAPRDRDGGGRLAVTP
ncbi:MAG TPA: universal stress protein [Jatrophihabitans sp.]|nr:universal stress protein [Jatrophihabitans sp.]